MSTIDPNLIPCPRCGSNNDLHASLENPGANPGHHDISLCGRCGTFSIFCIHEDENFAHLLAPSTGIEYAHIASVLQESM